MFWTIDLLHPVKNRFFSINSKVMVFKGRDLSVIIRARLSGEYLYYFYFSVVQVQVELLCDHKRMQFSNVFG